MELPLDVIFQIYVRSDFPTKVRLCQLNCHTLGWLGCSKLSLNTIERFIAENKEKNTDVCSNLFKLLVWEGNRITKSNAIVEIMSLFFSPKLYNLNKVIFIHKGLNTDHLARTIVKIHSFFKPIKSFSVLKISKICFKHPVHWQNVIRFFEKNVNTGILVKFLQGYSPNCYTKILRAIDRQKLYDNIIIFEIQDRKGFRYASAKNNVHTIPLKKIELMM